MKQTKTDNSNFVHKLALRRYFLEKYHGSGRLDVMDCCQGSGLIWAQLKQEFQLSSYWGLDVKKRKGRLTISSERVLAQAGWSQNVIDIDTYGAPWKHWNALLPNLNAPTTVFLTIGHYPLSDDHTVRRSLGLKQLPVPPSIIGKLKDFSIPYCLTQSAGNVIIIECLKAHLEQMGAVHMHYLGLRVVPKEGKV